MLLRAGNKLFWDCSIGQWFLQREVSILRSMNLSAVAGTRLFSRKNRTLSLMLAAAALLAAIYQSGCAGVAASNAALSGAQFNASTSTINMGNVALGDTKMATVTFTNSTSSPVTILNISVSGPGFGASGVPIGTILNPGQTAALSITFTPSSTGPQTGSITLTSSAVNSGITVGLQAAGVPAGDHLAALSWVSGGGSPVGYFIYRSPTTGGPYMRVNSAADANTAYTDSAVVAGQSYFYVVTAIGANNMESSYSNEVPATIPAP